MQSIPLVDLKAQYKSMKSEIDAAIQRVVDNTTFILGEEVQSFERMFAEYCQTKYCVGVASGTAALHLSLIAGGVRNGDEVITSPFTFIATAEAITHCGARPVFIDIESKTMNINHQNIEKLITRRTKAIIPVHLFGQPCNMNEINEIADKYGLVVIEDAAQAHGAEYKGKRVGSLGDIACFSFYPGKNLGAYGDGGAVVTNHDHFAQTIAKLRNHGREEKYKHEIVGFGERLDTLQASILETKLLHLDAWTESRRRIARKYNKMLSHTPLDLPTELPGNCHVYHLYVVRTAQRDDLVTYLEERGIGVGIHYPIPLHVQPAYHYLKYRQQEFPQAVKAAAEVVSLPMFPELKDEAISFVVEQISKFFKINDY